MVLSIALYKVVLPFESVDEILQCDHSNEIRDMGLCERVYFSYFRLCVNMLKKAVTMNCICCSLEILQLKFVRSRYTITATENEYLTAVIVT